MSEVNEKIPIVVIGTGGHSSSLIDVIESNRSHYFLLGLVSNEVSIGQKVNDYLVIGTDNQFLDLHNLGYSFVIGIGQIKSSSKRKMIYDNLKSIGANTPTIISPFSKVSQRAFLGDGNSVFHNVVINAYATVGRNCIINTNSLIEHDVSVGANCHISTGAILNGGVKVGNNCFIGSGSIISNNVEICDDVIIGAGSLVIKNVLESGTYYGNPAKKIM